MVIEMDGRMPEACAARESEVPGSPAPVAARWGAKLLLVHGPGEGNV